MISLRPYQEDARRQINTLLNASRDPILVMPTGTGKTKTATVIIDDRIALGKRVYVLTPQEEIFRQWMDDLTNAGLNPGYINDEGMRGKNRHVYVCMPLSMANLINYIPEKLYPDEIITDECHHSAAMTWEMIYAKWPGARRMGLTATPRRTDNKPLGHLYTDLVIPITMAEAVERKYLAKPIVLAPTQYEMQIPMKGDDFSTTAQAEKLGEAKIIGDVIQEYSHVFHGFPVLVACSTFDHAAQMTEEFTNAGWKWGHVHSNLPKHERRRLIRQISKGELNGLCTVGIGIEGMDIPGLYGLIWLRRTMSLTIYMQFNGRVLRPLPGKKYGVILDPVGNSVIHGFPDNDRTWGLTEKEIEEAEAEEQPEMVVCPACGVYNAKVNEFCHFCGCALFDPEFGGMAQTCHTCANYDPQNQYKEYCRIGVFSKEFLKVSGCPEWFKKARGIPTIEPGEFVLVTKSEDIEKVRLKAEESKAEAPKPEKQHLELSHDDKVKTLRDNLFKGSGRRSLFADTVRDFLHE